MPPDLYQQWLNTVENQELQYMAALDNGVSPEKARVLLPSNLATTVVASGNIREWRHVLWLRTGSGVEPSLRILMYQLLEALNKVCPVFFEDVYLMRQREFR
jgi:thymidylate synthase (FAD)